MDLLKKMVYMGLGGLLVLGVVIGGAAVFAQSGDGAEDATAPSLRAWRFHARGAPDEDSNERLAEALGISVEELQAAYDEVRLAVIDQALEEGLIGEEQAQQLRESERPLHTRRIARGLAINGEELLAEALDISVEELQAARAEVRAARLDALVESGVLTQEQADLIAAREAVSGYVDREGLAETIRDAYEAAINAALEEGAITQAQADALLEVVPNIGAPGLPGSGFHGGRGHHGRGFRFHGVPGSTFAPDAGGTIFERVFDA